MKQRYWNDYDNYFISMTRPIHFFGLSQNTGVFLFFTLLKKVAKDSITHKGWFKWILAKQNQLLLERILLLFSNFNVPWEVFFYSPRWLIWPLYIMTTKKN